MAITETKKIWMDGQLVDWADAKIHVLTHGLHYGTGVFEGIRAYETSQGPVVWRLTDHMRRLRASAKIALLDFDYSVEQLVDATKQTLRANELPSAYIRPIAFRGYGEMGLNPLPCPISVSIAMWPWGTYLGDEGVQNGIRAKISSWIRPDQNCMPPSCKATAHYLNSGLAKVEAIRSGYDEAILLNKFGHVAEGTGENVFIVRDGALITPPVSSGALEGITRHTIITMARDSGYEVREENLARADLYTAEEAFLTGTAAEVVPLRSVDDYEIGEPGAITRKMQEMYSSAARGEIASYRHWAELANE